MLLTCPRRVNTHNCVLVGLLSRARDRMALTEHRRLKRWRYLLNDIQCHLRGLRISHHVGSIGTSETAIPD
jgi:hypothetical protein